MFFWILGVPIYQIYGMTESSGRRLHAASRRHRSGGSGLRSTASSIASPTIANCCSRGPMRLQRLFVRRRRDQARHRRTDGCTPATSSRRRQRRNPHRRSQEGHPDHVGRQEHHAVPDRKRAEGLALYPRGHPARRRPPFPRRAHPDRSRNHRQMGASARALRTRPTARSRSTSGARARRRRGRSGQRPLRARRERAQVRHPVEGARSRRRRTDSDDESAPPIIEQKFRAEIVEIYGSAA